jgi:hypothetical protein
VSYVYEIDGETVWSPALRVGQIYEGYIATLSRSLGRPTGFRGNPSDHVMIDPEVFVDFVLRLLSATNGHPILAQQIDAVMGPSVVMLERSGTTIHATTPQEARLLDRARMAASSMPV